MNSVSFNFIVSFISRLITGGINVFLVSFLTRALSQSGYGEYNLVFAYLAIFLALTDLGLYSYLIRKISQESENESGIIGNVMTLRLLSNLFFIFIAFGLLFIVPYSGNVKLGIIIGFVFLITTSLTQILTAVYQKYLKMTDLAILDVVFRIVYLVFVLAIYYLDLGFIAFITALSFTELIHFIFVFAWARKITPIKLNVSLPAWKNSIAESYPIAISLFFVLLYFKFDTILLSFYRPAEDLAVYSLGYKILEAIIFFPAMYIGIVMPRLAKAFSTSLEESRRITVLIWNALWIGAIPTATFVFIYAKDIIRIFTPEDFVGADMVLKILALSLIPIFLGNLGGNALIAGHLQKKAMWVYGFAAIFNVTGNLIFMPKYGFYSASWMTLLTEILVTTLMFLILSKYLDSRMPIRVIFGSTLVCIAFAIFLSYMQISMWYGLLFFTLYPPVLFYSNIISQKELLETVNIQK